MPRNVLLSLYDWAQTAGVSVSATSGGFEAALPAANMLQIQPQRVAQATGASLTFQVALGATRTIGLVHLQNFVVDPAGTIRVQAGSYDSGTVGAWPADSTGAYNALLYAALGRPRVFVFPAAVLASTVTVTITGATTPLQIGYCGACEMWEPPQDIALSWHTTVLDESDVQRVPFGSSFVTLRGKRRRIDFGSNPIDDNSSSSAESNFDLALQLALVNGKSAPVIAVPFPADAENLERRAVWGLFSTDTQFENFLYGLYRTTWQIDQLI